jgi:hypothetical protein
MARRHHDFRFLWLILTIGSIGGGCGSVRRKNALATPLMMERHKLTAEPTERLHVRRNSLGDQNLSGFLLS